MAFLHVPPGSVIERVYFAVPEQYTIGTEFPDLEQAQRYARFRLNDLVTRLSLTLDGWATPGDIKATAERQVRVDLRWVIKQPDGTYYDTIIERFPVVEEQA